MPPVSSPGSLDSQVPRFTADDRAARVRFRRAMALMLMTLLLPGSAQLVAGNRRIGRIALRIWFVPSSARAAHAGRSAWSTTSCSSGSASDTLALFWLRLGADGARGRLGAAVLRRLADRPAADPLDGAPPRRGRRQRRALPRRGRARCSSAPTWSASSAHLMLTMFGDGEVERRPRRPLQRAAARRRLRRRPLGPAPGLDDDRQHRRRDRPDRADLAAAQHGELPVRPGLGDGRAVPRRLRRATTSTASAPGPTTTPSCSRSSEHPGVDATVMAVEGITGLKINYWAMVNLEGFKDLVDAVGGVTLNVRQSIPVGLAARPFSPTSSRACRSSTASRPCGSPGPATTPTTTRGWRGRSA